MKTFLEVAAWCAGAAAQFGDPSEVCGQIFARWQEDLPAPAEGDELVAGMRDGDVILAIAPDVQLPLTVRTGEAEIVDGGLEAFGAHQICAGVWALHPSLNVQGLIHVFVVLYDVPDPAPWERRIIVPEGGRIVVPA